MSRKVDQGRFVRNLALSLTVGIVVHEYVEEVFCRRYRMSMVLTRIKLDSL